MRRSPLLPALYITAISGLAGCGGPNDANWSESNDLENSATPLTGFGVYTRNYDGKRSGANLSETILGTGNVGNATFGKHFELAVDDQIYASILYASAVTIGGSP